MNKQRTAILMGIIYFLAGLNHFIMPNFYLKIMPPYLPFHLVLVYLSGFAEMFCGLLLTMASTRKIGAWLTIILLMAIFPANIQMTLDLSHIKEVYSFIYPSCVCHFNSYSFIGHIFTLKIQKYPLITQE